jgi:hypothetical protein
MFPGVMQRVVLSKPTRFQRKSRYNVAERESYVYLDSLWPALQEHTTKRDGNSGKLSSLKRARRSVGRHTAT